MASRARGCPLVEPGFAGAGGQGKERASVRMQPAGVVRGEGSLARVTEEST